jgi:hypothetical protein
VAPVKVSVAIVGDVPNTAAPDPVSSVRAAAKFALVDVPRNVATPVARPLTPVEIGRPVAFVRVPAEGVPMSGVTRAGDVANTAAPVPVSSVKAARKFALVGVAMNVETPVPGVSEPKEPDELIWISPVAPAGAVVREAAIVIEPLPFVIVTFDPAVRVALSASPVSVLPIISWPFV